jgi:putative membrane protein
MGYGMWHAGGMWIFWIAVLLVVVLAIVWAARSSGPRSAPPESPEEILKKRYARGEIGREEYQERLDELRR